MDNKRAFSAFKDPQETTHHEGLSVLTGHRRQKALEARLALHLDRHLASGELEQEAPLVGQMARTRKSEWWRAVDWNCAPEIKGKAISTM
jgi:hypothetical protein